MNTDQNGSYLREPSVSEGALKRRIETLIGRIPINEKTVVERTVMLGSAEIEDIDVLRATKEVEASLGHQIIKQAKVEMRFNPSWSSFEVSKLTFALPGTELLSGNLELDPDSGSYAAYLYDKETEKPIARNPVQPSTVESLLRNDTFIRNVTATTQEELLLELLQDTSVFDSQLTIRQSATLIEETIASDEPNLDSVDMLCSIEREQTYGSDEMLDVIRFINEVITLDASHARILTVYNSQHGSTITGEEVSFDNITRKPEQPRSVTFDYDTIEKLLAHVGRAEAAVDKL